MKKIIVAPSILSSDFTKLGSEIKMLEENGADWIHIDVMDGNFVPNLTIGIPIIKSLRKTTKIPFDVHLMISNPEKYIKDYALAGSDIITFHYEVAKENSENLINEIHSYGKRAGISIKPKTSVSEILKYIDKVDLILIMTVEPGFGGQKFMSECADKIKELRPKINNEIIIEVDGGINDITAKYCKDMGANALVAGNYVFSSDDKRKAIEFLRF